MRARNDVLSDPRPSSGNRPKGWHQKTSWLLSMRRLPSVIVSFCGFYERRVPASARHSHCAQSTCSATASCYRTSRTRAGRASASFCPPARLIFQGTPPMGKEHGIADSAPLFFSRKRAKDGGLRAISRQQAWEIVREASERADVRVLALRVSSYGQAVSASSRRSVPGKPAWASICHHVEMLSTANAGVSPEVSTTVRVRNNRSNVSGLTGMPAFRARRAPPSPPAWSAKVTTEARQLVHSVGDHPFCCHGSESCLYAASTLEPRVSHVSTLCGYAH
jgi:hypothetical protein